MNDAFCSIQELIRKTESTRKLLAKQLEPVLASAKHTAKSLEPVLIALSKSQLPSINSRTNRTNSK